MTTYTKLYDFAASSGALEGYVYRKKGTEELDMKALAVWVGNIVEAYHRHPDDVRFECQNQIDQTIGRAVQSLMVALGKDHELVEKLKTIIVGSMPDSPDDFQKKKWFQPGD